MTDIKSSKKAYFRPSLYINREDEIELIEYATNNGGMKELLLFAAQSFYRPLVAIDKKSSKEEILEAGLISLEDLRSQMLKILFALRIRGIELDNVALTALGLSPVEFDPRSQMISKARNVSVRSEKSNSHSCSLSIEEENSLSPTVEDSYKTWDESFPDIDEDILMQEKNA